MKNITFTLKDDLFILILIVISIPIVGELKFFPLNSTFRVSFSPVLFLFFLLWVKKLPIPLYGIVAGISTVIFRIILNYMFQSRFEINQAFLINFPSFFYYLIFSCLFYLTKINSLHNNSLLIGILSACIDILSSTCELIVRCFVLNNSISVYALGLISIVAIIRSFFVLGFFNIIKLNEVRTAANQQKEQNRYMLLLISNLYAESIQLKKSLTFAENITKDCYNLYEYLKNKPSKLNENELSQSLLRIAGQVHEIKKDNQRIYSGLSKMILSENSKDYMDIKEIGNIIIDTNKKYSTALGKNIDFSINISSEEIPDLHIYTVLSLINNLVSNSVESIEDTGIIKIYINKIGDTIKFQVSDNGIGIPEKKKDLIFKPGYTTKYNKLGKPSTGIGLSYVKQIVSNLKGKVILENSASLDKTTFTIELPIKSLIKEG